MNKLDILEQKLDRIIAMLEGSGSIHGMNIPTYPFQSQTQCQGACHRSNGVYVGDCFCGCHPSLINL